MNKLLIIACILFSSCANRGSNITTTQEPNKILHDKHVHIMSPQLISLWKGMGIPFSKADHYYSLMLRSGLSARLY